MQQINYCEKKLRFKYFKKCDSEWPLKSCNLTPLDYLLWDYLKSLVFRIKLDSPYALQAKIEGASHGIRLDLVKKKSARNWLLWFCYCRSVNRGNFFTVVHIKKKHLNNKWLVFL